LIGNEVIPSLPLGTNKAYVSFYTPWQLAGATLDGAPVEMERATELGRQVYSAAVVIPPKSTVTLELTLSGRLPGSGPYRLDIYREPVVSPDDVTTALAVGSGSSGQETSNRQLQADATVEARRP
jgi:hypothetical protein